MRWTVETFNDAVDREIKTLPDDVRVKIAKYRKLIEEQGLDKLPTHALKHLEGKLWELRITGRDGIARIIYLTLSGRRMVLLRALVKKTQKTPLAELELARTRMRSIVQPH